VCQFVAQQSFDLPVPAIANTDTIYTLAMMKPDKIRLTLKGVQSIPWEQRMNFHLDNSPYELMIVSDGDTTWRYSAKTRKYTREQSAFAGHDPDDEPAPPLDRLDLLTAAQNTLLSQYIKLPKDAAAARIAKIDQIKIAGAKIDCYVLQFRLPHSSNELWIDKQRFLVLRQVQKTNTVVNGQIKMTLNFKQADISNTPENDLFTFTPPEKAIQVQTLPGEQPDLTGRVATDFSLRSLESAKVTLSELRGKVVLLNFWATWCRPCLKELSIIEKLHREYEAKGLVVLGISGEDSASVKNFLKQNQYTQPVLMDDKRDVHRMYGARSIPTVIVIDRSGVIRAHEVGGRSEGELIAALRSAGLE
jgi:peroxiredoxin/outer membrane lipoprotein-sorting protein